MLLKFQHVAKIINKFDVLYQWAYLATSKNVISVGVILDLTSVVMNGMEKMILKNNLMKITLTKYSQLFM